MIRTALASSPLSLPLASAGAGRRRFHRSAELRAERHRHLATWCGSAISSTMPARRADRRSIARPISAPPARCRRAGAAALRAQQVIGVTPATSRKSRSPASPRTLGAKDLETAVARRSSAATALAMPPTSPSRSIAARRHPARRLQHRRAPAGRDPLRRPQRPFRHRLRDQQRQQSRRRPSCASPAPRSRPWKSPC